MASNPAVLSLSTTGVEKYHFLTPLELSIPTVVSFLFHPSIIAFCFLEDPLYLSLSFSLVSFSPTPSRYLSEYLLQSPTPPGSFLLLHRIAYNENSTTPQRANNRRRLNVSPPSPRLLLLRAAHRENHALVPFPVFLAPNVRRTPVRGSDGKFSSLITNPRPKDGAAVGDDTAGAEKFASEEAGSA